MQEEKVNVSDRISFDDKNIEPSKTLKDSKVDVSKSRFTKKTAIKQQFEERAAQTHEAREGNQVRAAQIGQEFMRFFNQKILPQNKGPMEKSFEREIIGKLIQYAIDINNDEFEKDDGMGSVSMITLLFNTVIKLRDRCNLLEYKILELEQKISKHVEPTDDK